MPEQEVMYRDPTNATEAEELARMRSPEAQAEANARAEFEREVAAREASEKRERETRPESEPSRTWGFDPKSKDLGGQCRVGDTKPNPYLQPHVADRPDTIGPRRAPTQYEKDRAHDREAINHWLFHQHKELDEKPHDLHGRPLPRLPPPRVGTR